MVYYPKGTWDVGGSRVTNPGDNKPGVGSSTRRKSFVHEGSSRRRSPQELRDTARKLETIDPHLGLSYEAAARRAEVEATPDSSVQAATPTNITPTTPVSRQPQKLFSTAEAAQGMSYATPRFVPVSGGSGFRVPAFNQTILSREKPRYEQALDVASVVPRRRVEVNVESTRPSSSSVSGKEARIKGIMQREQRLSESKNWVYDKLHISPGNKNFFVEAGKAVARLPVEVASIPVFVGGRTGLIIEASASRAGRSELLSATKDVPSAIKTTFNPKTPTGLVNLAVVTVPLMVRVGPAYKSAKTTYRISKVERAATDTSKVWGKEYVYGKEASKIEINILENPKASPQLKAIVAETSGSVRQQGIPTLKGDQLQLFPKDFKPPSADRQLPLEITKSRPVVDPLKSGEVRVLVKKPKLVVPSVEVLKAKATGTQTQLVSEVTGTSFFRTKGGGYSDFVDSSKLFKVGRVVERRPAPLSALFRSRKAQVLVGKTRLKTEYDFDAFGEGKASKLELPEHVSRIVAKSSFRSKPFEFPTVKVASFVGTRTKPKQGVNVVGVLAQRGGFVFDYSVKQQGLPATKSDVSIEQLQRQRQRTKQRTVSLQLTEQVLSFPEPEFSPFTETKSSPNPPVPSTKLRGALFALPKLDFTPKKKKEHKKRGLPKPRYRPSIVAKEAHITAQQKPDIITGISVRPIVGGT